ncbi:uncharacterized protein [Solanum lycopersicum]|uniref:uncharacterized protein n=1 Tax=Solanum lycopersicum TaxID=4081 RepID=UPI0037488379
MLLLLSRRDDAAGFPCKRRRESGRERGKEETGGERGEGERKREKRADGREREREKRCPATDFAGAATGRLTSSERRRGEKEIGKRGEKEKMEAGRVRRRGREAAGEGWRQRGVATSG